MSQKSSWWSNHAFVTGLIAIAIAFVFLSAVGPSVEAYVLPANSPQWEVNAVYVIQEFFNFAPPAVLAAWGWSLFGYIRQYAGDSETEYDLTKLGQTIMWFIGIMGPVTVALGTNPNATGISAGISTGFMTLKAVWSQLQDNEQAAIAGQLPAGTSPTPTLSSNGMAEGVSGSNLVFWNPTSAKPPAGTVQVPYGLTFAQAQTWISEYPTTQAS
jgi:hypothetical protein